MGASSCRSSVGGLEITLQEVNTVFCVYSLVPVSINNIHSELWEPVVVFVILRDDCRLRFEVEARLDSLVPKVLAVSRR